MRLRLAYFASVCSALVSLLASTAGAAPQAAILRIDPRAAQGDGSPVLSTVIEIAQAKRLSDVLQDCVALRGEPQLLCMSEKLSQPRALYTPFPFPEQSALFTVNVDNADQPAKFVDKHQFAESQNLQGVGTAWLILLDASSGMGPRLNDAKAVAEAFVNAMGPQDLADVMVFGDSQVVSKDTKWLPAARKGELAAAIAGTQVLPHGGRARPLVTILKTAVADAFRELGNAGQSISVPFHQSLVVLSDGSAGADPQSNGAVASQLSDFLTQGRLDERNTALPKMPLPVVSIYFPVAGLSEEFTNNARDFMTNLANPQIGGYFNVVRGNANAVAGPIAGAVRERYGQMFFVRWRVGCVAPTTTQSFKLDFRNVNPQILGDHSFTNVPIGIDPSTWPLSIDVANTKQQSDHDPIVPGGKFTVFGDFCWGSNKDRAQVYFVPKGQSPPAISMNDIEKLKQAQRQLVASHMDGKALSVTDTTATFEAPDTTNLLWGSGDKAIAYVVVYDAGARRMSGVTAQTILTLKAGDKPFPVLWLAVGGFGLLVIALLLVAALRGGGGGGGKRKRANAPPPAPVVPPAAQGGPPGYGGPGGAPPGYGGAPPGYNGGPGAPPGYGGQAPPGYGGGPPPGYGASAHADHNAALAGAAAGAAVGSGTAMAPQYGVPPAVSPEFLYGGAPAQYGLTTGQPAHAAAPPDPYGGGPFGQPSPNAAASGRASRAVISGAEGVFTFPSGHEVRVGRDPSTCQIVLAEPRVSSVHATGRIDPGAAQFVLRDESSNNGTHVNGLRIAPGVWTPVPNNSVVRFGPAEFNVRVE